MSLTIGFSLLACQLLLTYYPLISMTRALWSGITYSTTYIYRWKYPPPIKDIDPKYQVLTKNDLSKLDDDTKTKLIDVYGEDIFIISSKSE